MTQHFNYRHLHYFWVVAKEGSMTKAASRLNIAVQTISTQVHELEKDLGHLLFKPAGRGLALTDAGFAAMKLADQIFQIGEKLPSIVSGSAATPRNRLALGVADGLPKLVSKQLLDSVIHEQQIQLVCHEGEFDDLLADLALHRLDLVFADRPAPVNKNMSLYSQELGRSPISWLAAPDLLAKAKINFPYSLASIPVIMPTYHSTVRFKLDLWFEKLGITPNVVGEFEDNALMVTFGSSGFGVFPAASILTNELEHHYQVHQIGACEDIHEYFYAIRSEKRTHHPLVQSILKQVL
ncbi:MAG: LysR family transcriptional regulator [Polynucleobacter sp.]|nr:LysR family transcriptional regulator [Polynucleobacter sp.]